MAISAALLVVGFAASLVMFAMMLGAGIAIGVFVRWKTHELRKKLREEAIRDQQMHEQQVRDRTDQRMDMAYDQGLDAGCCCSSCSSPYRFRSP